MSDSSGVPGRKEADINTRRFLRVVAILAVLALLLGCEIPFPVPDAGGEDSVPPAPVSSVSADPAAGQVTLTWVDPDADDFNRVEVSWAPADGGAQPTVASAGEEVLVVSGLHPESDYSFTLVGVDDSGNRSAEQSVHATTLPLFDGAGTTIIASGTSDNVTGADVNGDGIVDLLASGTGTDSVVWFENDGLAGFSGGVAATDLLQKVWGIDAADMDGDGDLDLLSVSIEARAIPNRVAWYENTAGDGSVFTGHDISTAVDHPRDVAAADLDGDGDYDVLVSSRDDHRVIWYENSRDEDGDTEFSTGSQIDGDVEDAGSVHAVDLDGDGDLDVLAGSLGRSGVRWYENRLDRDEGFVYRDSLSDGSSFRNALFSTDVDGDGDADVIATAGDTDQIVWFENSDGNGTFAEAVQIGGTIVFPNRAVAGDVDADGDPDIVAVSNPVQLLGQGEDRIVWIENSDGAGDFTAAATIATDIDEPSSVQLADVDGDGDLDVIVSSHSGALRWYRNQLVN